MNMSINYEVIAEKDGSQRGFTALAWSLLPADKNGWTAVSGKTKKKEAKKPKPKAFVPPEVDSSKDYRLDELAEQLKKFNSEKEIVKFLANDTRTGAKKMADLRIKELNQ
jgi:phosphoserine aminotransferase